MGNDYIAAIDQGTTSTRTMVFDEKLKVANFFNQEFKQIYPDSGLVEHNAEDIWKTVKNTLKKASHGLNIKALGITNQRETVVLWNKSTGKPVSNAVVWQDRRTSAYCEKLINEGLSATIRQKTGLLLDPYFSATKIRWLLNNVAGVKQAAKKGEICFGTVDSFLLWRLTGGKVHATDATNASRTLLYNINKGQWDDELLKLFDIPKQILPKVKDSSGMFGETTSDLLGKKVPICGVAGDQHAALIGQAGFDKGAIKSTYGTGCFVLVNTGEKPVFSKNQLLTTIAYQIGGKTTYALEGSIYVAGAVVQWLRDGLALISDASQINSLADKADANSKVVLVPAFVGLGAPYWDSKCRGAIYNLTRATTAADIAKAALEAVAFQTFDLLSAVKLDMQDFKKNVLKVDGGMSASNFTMQYLANITGLKVDRPTIKETTALGAAYLAGLALQILPEPDKFAQNWLLEKRFEPDMVEDARQKKIRLWQDAVYKTMYSPPLNR